MNRSLANDRFPLAPVADVDRPAPLSDIGEVRRIALFAGSLVLHSLVLAMFWQDGWSVGRHAGARTNCR